jgi:hypothetical protein
LTINFSFSTQADADFQLQVGTHKQMFLVSPCISMVYKKLTISRAGVETPESANLRQFISIIVQSGTHLPLTPPNPFASIRSDPTSGPEQRGVFGLIERQRSASCPGT